MAEEIKSKTSDLFVGMANASSIGKALCSTPEDLEKFKKYNDSVFADLAVRYKGKPGHTKRLKRVRKLAEELIKIANESENAED